MLVAQSAPDGRRNTRVECPDQECQRRIKSRCGRLLSGLICRGFSLCAGIFDRLNERIHALLSFIGRHPRVSRYEVG